MAMRSIDSSVVISCISVFRWFVVQCIVFFFNDTTTTEIYTLSLHDALPICTWFAVAGAPVPMKRIRHVEVRRAFRSEEHTSELQSQSNLVCRLLLEKKKTTPLHFSQVIMFLIELLQESLPFLTVFSFYLLLI